MKRHNCHARQYSDQMICTPCGLAWDMNDPEPPECKRHAMEPKLKTKRPGDGLFKVDQSLLEALKARSSLPHELPDDVAVEMVKTYQANARDGIKGQIAGMQAAYRLFLDRVEL